MPSAISWVKRFAWPTTRLVEASNLRSSASAAPRSAIPWRARPGNVQRPQFDAPAVVAHFCPELACNGGDLLHHPSRSRLESVGQWMLVSTNMVSTRIRRNAFQLAI
jgi:hypothetical protein